MAVGKLWLRITTVNNIGVQLANQMVVWILQIVIFVTLGIYVMYRIYSLMRRTIFYEKICLFDENLLKIRGAYFLSMIALSKQQGLLRHT